jgi:aminoglycoside phosphotransferase (APT) family kinase protein
VPDLRIETVPSRFEEVLREELPLSSIDVARFRAFLPTLATLCAELTAADVAASVQHDDLHFGNVFVNNDVSLILDWGDSSISHPFASAVVTFRFLEEQNGLAPGSRWFKRLRDAYLEPWGLHQIETFELAQRVGIFAHVCAWARQRSFLPESDRSAFDKWFSVILARASARIPL